VVDANRVSAPLDANVGNVGRFPGALGGRRTLRIGHFELQIRDAQERVKSCAQVVNSWTEHHQTVRPAGGLRLEFN
jgi:hypothetical protein